MDGSTKVGLAILLLIVAASVASCWDKAHSPDSDPHRLISLNSSDIVSSL